MHIKLCSSLHLKSQMEKRKDFHGFESSTKLCRASVNQVFFFMGLNNSSPMIAGAMTNTLPVLTFVFALIFKYCILSSLIYLFETIKQNATT